MRRLFTRESAFISLCVLALVTIIAYGIIQSRTMINPAAYKPLLNVIAEGESRGNYNAYFGSVSNNEIRFTTMSIADVLEWQTRYVEQGSPSNAVGRYQIIQPTLQGLIDEYTIDTSLLFNEAMQDKLAIALMERRGSIPFIEQKVSAEEFAHNLSKEWAALPKIIGEAPEASYYDGDGLNASQINSTAILGAIDTFKQNAEEE